MPLGLFHYQLLSDILEKIHFIYEEEELCRVILEALSRSLNTEAGTIFRISDSEEIVPTAAYGASLDTLKALKFTVGKGVVGWVAQYCQPLKVDNARTDPRFMGAADSATGFRTRCLVAAPIIVKGKTIGVLEFINKKGGGFNIPDLELLSMIGRELGIAFENVRLIVELRENHAHLCSIVSGLGAGLLVMDHEHKVLVINPRALQLLGVAAEPPSGQRPPVKELAARLPEFSALMIELAKGGKPVERGQLKTFSGQKEVVFGYSATPVASSGGKPPGMTFLFQDITAYAKKPAAPQA